MGESALFQTVKSAFNEDGWGFSEIPDREVIQAGFEAHHTRVNLHVQAFSELSAVFGRVGIGIERQTLRQKGSVSPNW